MSRRKDATLAGFTPAVAKNEVRPATASVPANVAALLNVKGAGEVLRALRIHDDAGLKTLGTRLAAQASGKAQPSDSQVAKLATLAKTVDPKVLSTVVQAAGTTLSGKDKALVSSPAFADAVAQGKSVAQAKAATTTADSKGLAALGLTEKDLAAAAEAAKPALTKAVQAAANGKMDEALAALAEAAKAGGPVLVEKALPKLAEKLPDGVTRQILTNPGLVHSLVEDAPDVIAKLAKGDYLGAADGLKNEPAVQQLFREKLGIDLSKVADPSALFARGAKVLDHLEKGEWASAVRDLQALAKELPPEAVGGAFQKLGQAIGAKLPEDARAHVQELFDAIAVDPEKGAALVDVLDSSRSLPNIVEAFAKGDPRGALDLLAKDSKLLDVAGDAIASMKVVQDALGRVGIDLEGVKDPGKALAGAMALGEHLQNGDWAAATKDLQALAKNVDAKTFSGVLEKISDKLPAPVKDFLGKVGEKLAGDPKKGEALLKALENSKTLPSMVEALAKGDVTGALAQLAKDSKLLDAAGDAVATMQVVEDACAKIGIDLKGVKDPGQVLTGAAALSEHLQKGDWAAATKDLQALAKNVDAKTFAGVLEKISDKLPAPVRDFLGKVGEKLAGDPKKGEALLEALENSKTLPSMVEALAKGDVTGALAQLAQDTKLLDAAGDAVATMQVVKDACAKVGIDLAGVKDPGQVLTGAIALGEHLQKGDWAAATKDLQALAKNVDAKTFAGVLEKISDKLPAPVKDFLGKVGEKLAADPKKGEALMKALQDSKQLPNLVAALAKGDGAGALDALAADTKLLDAAGDAIASTKLAKDVCAKVGIDLTKVGDPGKVLASAVAMADHLEAGDWAAATEDLQALAKNLGTEAFQGLWDKVSAKLPAPVKDFLTKAAGNGEVQNLFKTLGESESLPAMVAKLASGDVGGALTTAADDAQLMSAVGQALVSLPAAQKFLQDKLGLTAAQAKSLGAAVAPQLAQAVESAAQGDVEGALTHLLDAAKDIPPDVAKAATDKILADLQPKIDKLPPAAKAALNALARSAEVLVENADDPNLRAGLKQIAQGDVAGGLRTIAKSTALMTDVGAALAESPEVQSFLKQKLGLNAEQVAELGAALPDLMQAVAAKTPEEALSAIKAAAEKSPKVLEAIGDKVWEMLPAKVRSGLTALGLDQANLKELGEALPSVLSAAEKIGQGNWKGALEDLGQALQSAPNTVAKAVSAVASKIPDDPKLELLKAALTDQKLIAQLVGDQDLHAGFKQILSGDFAGGLKAIAGNDAVMTEVGRVLLGNAKASEFLAKVGITKPEDFAQLGDAIGDVVELSSDLHAGRYQEALEDFGKVLSDLPIGMRTKMGEAVAKALGLPEGLADLVIEGGVALSDPEIRAQLGRAVESLRKSPPDAGAFVDALAGVGELISTKYPDAAVGFLDLMGKLPGSVGRFFSNHELNDMLVKSGSVTNAFQAMRLLAQGKIPEALQELGDAVTAFIGQPPHYNVDLPWPVGDKELPFGEKGIEGLALLFGQFVEALPAKVKEKVLAETAKLAAKAGGSLIPGGSLLGLVGDAPDLYGAITAKPPDGLDIALKATKCGLDVAGVIPGVGAVTGPLGTVVGIVDFVHGAADLVGDLKEFKDEFAFGMAA
ncbi:MAG: hypothetical protein QM765_07910 [Myxococcales bacterium]